MTGRVGWAATGALSATAGMAVAHLVAALRDIATSPVLAVGSAVIDRTPTPVKEWAIRTFGSADKPILVGSVLLGVLALAAATGLLARRRLAYGAAALALLAGVAGLAVLDRPTAAVADLVPTAVAVVVAVLTLVALSRTRATEPQQPPRGFMGRAQGRRGFLVASGAVAVLSMSSGAAGYLVGRLRLRPEDVTLPAPADAAAAFPRGLDAQVPGITPFRTPTADFYRVDTRLDTPVVSAEDWTLTIDGDVDRKVVLTFDELLAMPLVERDITLTCVSNSVGGPYVGGARWLGVRLTDVLALAGVGASADQILSTDFDGMTISTPLDLATDGRDALVCVGMNGSPLPREHGFPVRLVVPGLYGFISATKWLTRLTLTTYAEREAYWTKRDWATDAPIKASARIDTPRALTELDAGDIVIGGVAWAQADEGVSGVQVRIDGGPWEDAQLGPSAGNPYWRQWFLRWRAEPGSHSLAARTITGDGSVQSAARAEPFPSGSSGVHELLVEVG